MSEQILNEKDVGSVSSKGIKDWQKTDTKWWETDQLDTTGWGFAFLWGALVMLADNSEISANIEGWNSWGVFLAGFGFIAILIALLRLTAKRQHGKVASGLVFGLILIGVGLGDSLSWIFPVVFLVIGVYILRGVFFSQN